MKKLHNKLFQQISWSTDEVLKQTIQICKNLNVSMFLLPELSDIDNENDLKKAQEKLLL